MKTIAVTGGIGSGKSEVCSILSSRGIPVYDSDSAAKRLYREDDSLLDSVEGAFGQSFRTTNGDPDLKKLASVVFSSPEKLKTLESLVHPAVKEDFRRWKAMCTSTASPRSAKCCFKANCATSRKGSATWITG